MEISDTVNRLSNIFQQHICMMGRQKGGKEANVQKQRGGGADVQTDGRQWGGGGEDRQMEKQRGGKNV